MCQYKSQQNELLNPDVKTSCLATAVVADVLPVALPCQNNPSLSDSSAKDCDGDSDTCDDNINNATFTLPSSKHDSSPTLCPRPLASAIADAQVDSRICSPPYPPGTFILNLLAMPFPNCNVVKRQVDHVNCNVILVCYVSAIN